MLGLISCMDLSSAKPEVLRVTYLSVTPQDSSFKYVSLLLFFAPAWYLRCHLEKLPLFPALTVQGKKLSLGNDFQYIVLPEKPFTDDYSLK